ncbi:unnamed protein product [Lactuca saligna]|uniref:Thaumatin-like protein n=1 Tax=Lactuca saligna TaxID=75948 RepID=A0AA36DX39_LACSI|nr:unnamed protein product [Lactuca saligna]
MDTTLPTLHAFTWFQKPYINDSESQSVYTPTTTMIFHTASTFLLFFFSLCFHIANAANFNIHNNCPFTVWAGATPGGGRQLNFGESWSLDVAPGTSTARIWPRTNCNFDGSGRGSCQTGDCNGLLQCQAFGKTPNTVAEYALNQYMNFDYFDVSVIDGFNLPMEFSPTSGGCTSSSRCIADINGQCPDVLRTPGGCNNPCTVFKNQKYCCYTEDCGPTEYSRFFKDRCPDFLSYKNDRTGTFSCPGGTNYRVVFCP